MKEKGEFYYYSGTHRHNATYVSKGHSAELPIKDGAIVVFQTIYFGSERGKDPNYFGYGELKVSVHGKIIDGPNAEFSDLFYQIGICVNLVLCVGVCIFFCNYQFPGDDDKEVKPNKK